MMLLRRLVTSLALVVFLASCLLGQASPPIFPLTDVRPGLKGVGRTIFEGDKIDEFQVEILGVLKNALAPQRDLILGRLSGGPLATTGVVSGMSGSPVYVDGKLVGAVSRAFPLSKGAIAGITPIEEMLTVLPSPPASTARLSPNESFRIVNTAGGSPDLARVIANDVATPGLVPLPGPDGTSGPSLSSLLLPLRFGGFSSASVDLFAAQLRRLGLEPMQGGVIAGSAQNTPPSPTDLQPGSMISLMLVQGDLNVNIDCTVTLRQGNNLYACGHQVLAEGPAQFPFAPAHVIVTVPSISSSFKVDAPGAIAGTIRQDRFDAIYGQRGWENAADDSRPRAPGFDAQSEIRLQFRNDRRALSFPDSPQPRNDFRAGRHGTLDWAFHPESKSQDSFGWGQVGGFGGCSLQRSRDGQHGRGHGGRAAGDVDVQWISRLEGSGYRPQHCVAG